MRKKNGWGLGGGVCGLGEWEWGVVSDFFFFFDKDSILLGEGIFL